MGFIGNVSGSEPVEIDESKVRDVKVDPGGNAIVTCHDFSPGGIDAPPLPGDLAAVMEVESSGDSIVVGYLDQKNASVAGGGEFRIYARDADKNVVVEIHLKGDGSVFTANENGNYTLKKSGVVDINNGNFTVDP